MSFEEDADEQRMTFLVTLVLMKDNWLLSQTHQCSRINSCKLCDLDEVI